MNQDKCLQCRKEIEIDMPYRLCEKCFSDYTKWFDLLYKNKSEEYKSSKLNDYVEKLKIHNGEFPEIVKDLERPELGIGDRIIMYTCLLSDKIVEELAESIDIIDFSNIPKDRKKAIITNILWLNIILRHTLGEWDPTLEVDKDSSIWISNNLHSKTNCHRVLSNKVRTNSAVLEILEIKNPSNLGDSENDKRKIPNKISGLICKIFQDKEDYLYQRIHHKKEQQKENNL